MLDTSLMGTVCKCNKMETRSDKITITAFKFKCILTKRHFSQSGIRTQMQYKLVYTDVGIYL